MTEETKIIRVKDFQKKYGISLAQAKKYLELADYQEELAHEIAKYYSLSVKQSYPVGKVIRDYWLNKEYCRCHD